jgi:hypothetical protein
MSLLLGGNILPDSMKRVDISFSAIWIFANIAYAGMRAQGKGDKLWRVISFVAGFPGTLLTFALVREGSERAYGVDLPAKR